MSAIYDIAGTSNDTFMINGKATFIQGSVPPQNYQGVDGDIYLQSGDDATIHIKKNGVWRNLSNEALPTITGDEDIGKFLFVDSAESFGLAKLKFVDGAISTEVPAGEEGNALYATMAENDQFRIRVGGETDSGWIEMATGDNGNEPVYIRQYRGNLNDNPTIKNTFTVLDENGYTWLAKHPAASSLTDSLQVPTIGWINDSTKSTNVVHRTDEETITGVKTISIPGSDANDSLIIKNPISIADAIPTTSNGRFISFKDKNNVTEGYLEFYHSETGLRYAALNVCKEGRSTNQIAIGYDSNDEIFTKAPTPKVNDSSDKIATTAWVNDTSNNLVHKSGNETISNTKTFNGQITSSNIVPRANTTYNIGDSNLRYSNVYATTFNGTATQANWADLAEYYDADDEYPEGTMMMFGGEKEVTIATTDVNAVVSSKPGVILNNDADFEHPCKLALVGRVPVRVIGKCSKFDYLQISEIAGVAKAIPDEDFNFSNVVARTLEDKNYEEEGLVLCVIKFEL